MKPLSLTVRQASSPSELTGPPGLVRRPGQPPAPAVVRAVQPERRAPVGDRRTHQVRVDGLDRPGLYRLRVAGAAGGAAAETALADEEPAEYIYAVNPPAGAEGDLASLKVDEIRKIIGEDVTVLGSGEVGQSRKELIGGTEVSRTLLYVVLALCLLETLMAQRFGHFRE